MNAQPPLFRERDSVRSDMSRERDSVRSDMSRERDSVRSDMSRERDSVRSDMSRERDSVRSDMLIKECENQNDADTFSRILIEWQRVGGRRGQFVRMA